MLLRLLLAPRGGGGPARPSVGRGLGWRLGRGPGFVRAHGGGSLNGSKGAVSQPRDVRTRWGVSGAVALPACVCRGLACVCSAGAAAIE
jgi:hypothetical protein